MKLHNNKDWLYQKYVIEGLPQKDIAPLCGLKSKYMIGIKLREFNIPSKSIGDYLSGKKYPPLTKEHRQKISMALKGKKKNKEHIQKVSNSIKKNYKNRGPRLCKQCGAIANNKNRTLLCEACHKEWNRKYSKKWRRKNPEKAQALNKKYYQIHGKKWQKSQRGKEWRREYENNRRKTDIQFRLRDVLRTRVRSVLKFQKGKRVGSAIKDLGCSISFLKNHLENQFKKGMTWENYGKKWEIDHIVPLSKFDLSNRQQLLMVCHYTNLQPLWKEENNRKRAQLDY